jgi:hypothetical protein
VDLLEILHYIWQLTTWGLNKEALALLEDLGEALAKSALGYADEIDQESADKEDMKKFAQDIAEVLGDDKRFREALEKLYDDDTGPEGDDHQD